MNERFIVPGIAGLLTLSGPAKEPLPLPPSPAASANNTRGGGGGGNRERSC